MFQLLALEKLLYVVPQICTFQSPHPPGQPLALGFDQEQKIKEALSNTFLESSIMTNRCYFLPGLF